MPHCHSPFNTTWSVSQQAKNTVLPHIITLGQTFGHESTLQNIVEYHDVLLRPDLAMFNVQTDKEKEMLTSYPSDSITSNGVGKFVRSTFKIQQRQQKIDKCRQETLRHRWRLAVYPTTS